MQHTRELDITFSEGFMRDLEKMLVFCIENDTDSVEIEFGPVVDGVRFYANVDFCGRKIADKSCTETSADTLVREGESKHSFAKKLCDAIIRSEVERIKKEDYETEKNH